MHLGGVDAGDLVRRDRHTDPGAADEDGAGVLAAGDRLRDAQSDIGVVGPVARVGAVVRDLDACVAEHRGQAILQGQPRVVGANRDRGGHAAARTDATISRKPAKGIAARPTKSPSTPAAKRPATSPGPTLPP